MKRFIHFTLLSVLFGLYSSCNSDDKNDCVSAQRVFVTSVTSPSSGMVNEVISINVNFQVFNGCGDFNRFIEVDNGNTIDIEVEAVYNGCVCTTDAPIRTVNYEFETSVVGDYELNFKSNENEFITVNLTIN